MCAVFARLPLVDSEPRSAAMALAPCAVEVLSKKMRKTQVHVGMQLQAPAGGWVVVWRQSAVVL